MGDADDKNHLRLQPSSAPEQRFECTIDALGAHAASITGDVRTIGETMESLSGALDAVSGETDMQTMGALGIAGLPFMATWAAMKKAGDRYVQERTGQPLSYWTDFAGLATDRFEQYVTELARLESWAAARQATVGAGADPAGLNERDLELLGDIRHETQGWKVVLTQVAGVGQVVEAVLSAQQSQDEPEERDGLTRFRQKMTDAVAQSGMGTSELRDWLLRPLVEIRDQAQRLPSDIDRLADQVSLLEIELELAVAQAQALNGTLPPELAEITELRVAASVVLPALMARLDDAQHEVALSDNHLERLAEAHKSGEISNEVNEHLAERYNEQLFADQQSLDQVKAELRAWRTDGPTMVSSAVDWIDRRLELLRARLLVEQDEELGHTIRLLEAEKHHLVPVKAFLDT